MLACPTPRVSPCRQAPRRTGESATLAHGLGHARMPTSKRSRKRAVRSARTRTRREPGARALKRNPSRTEESSGLRRSLGVGRGGRGTGSAAGPDAELYAAASSKSCLRSGPYVLILDSSGPAAAYFRQIRSARPSPAGFRSGLDRRFRGPTFGGARTIRALQGTDPGRRRSFTIFSFLRPKFGGSYCFRCRVTRN